MKFLGEQSNKGIQDYKGTKATHLSRRASHLLHIPKKLQALTLQQYLSWHSLTITTSNSAATPSD
eukprot:4651117-Amphidinium_carterae.1